MKTRSQTICCIGRRADKSGLRPSKRNQAEVGNCVTGKISSPEHPRESQNRENLNLGPLDPPYHKNISKAKIIKWSREEYKEVMTAFYQALKEPKDNTTKQTYKLWRQKVGEHVSYIDANKLVNVRRDIMKKNRLTAAEIEEIKMKIRQPINTEQQNPEDAKVRLENLTPEQLENTIEQVRQGNEINNINQPVQNETFAVENQKAIEEIKIEILEEFFKTQNMNIEEQEPLLKLETNKKNKLSTMIGNIALDQIIKDIKPKDTTTLNELTHSTAKAITERYGMRKENRDRTSHKQPA